MSRRGQRRDLPIYIYRGRQVPLAVRRRARVASITFGDHSAGTLKADWLTS